MRFGVFLPVAGFPGYGQGETLTAAVDAAVAAERAGFDDVWIAEHHFMTYGLCPSATTLAAYVLGRTERVGVGTAVSVLSSQHPVALAEQAALLDQVSGGRFRLGVGRGGPWVDLEVFGTGLDRFENGFEEGLDLLVAALGQGRVAADGDTFRFREVELVPRPGRPMRPTVAATSPGTARTAGARGLPLLLGLHVGDQDKAALVAAHAEAALAHGHDPAGAAHVAAGVAYVADTTAEAVAVLRASLPRWLGPGLAGHRPVDGRAHVPRDAGEYADLLCRLHPVGSPGHCADTMLATIERTGIRHLILLVEGAGDPALTRRAIARLGAEVLPAVRSAC
ncbi:LLM class flavin-dependent oxidoreductase [Sphaerisporangium corydalis]|uniref:LLM class flavin-dependent oxidoreductase n=1 Tax=Sphaerisporangium corydalis TaxID=1441875 RepID=A0ABV9E9Q3_9ACTN|nr:LLM class flavin-dependent oxidoreductase [Sphaerisporangium corydalis]